MINEVLGIHIEPTNICTLKCPGCSRTQFLNQWPNHWVNHYLDIDQVLKFIDIDLNDLHILLCGTYGDPIYHPHFLDFFGRIKKTGAKISIVTNGSFRSAEWWHLLTQHMDQRDTVIFSIDGTPDNFTQYRKNADWTSIQVGIQACVTGACQTVWKFLVFEYNQDSIDDAQNLSQQLGVDRFQIELSDRFDLHTLEYQPRDSKLLGARYAQQQKFKNNQVIEAVDARCKSGREHFISADGYYNPCCYLSDHRFRYKTQFGKQQQRYAIKNNSLTSVLQDQQVLDFFQNLQTNPGCQYNCPKTHS